MAAVVTAGVSAGELSPPMAAAAGVSSDALSSSSVSVVRECSIGPDSTLPRGESGPSGPPTTHCCGQCAAAAPPWVPWHCFRKCRYLKKRPLHWPK
ncbi:MATH domain-containing protein [Pycnococcus provasolii]